jgi:hypothetical protein
MIELAVFLKRQGYRPDQVQDFIPAPMDVATCMYYTELDPFTMKPVYIAKKMRDRRFQRALLQFFKPENWFEVRAALLEAGRADLIGEGCDCLISATPPKEAIAKRREDANGRFGGEYYHDATGAKSAGKERRSRHVPSQGYRPGRKPPKNSDGT